MFEEIILIDIIRKLGILLRGFYHFMTVDNANGQLKSFLIEVDKNIALIEKALKEQQLSDTAKNLANTSLENHKKIKSLIEEKLFVTCENLKAQGNFDFSKKGMDELRQSFNDANPAYKIGENPLFSHESYIEFANALDINIQEIIPSAREINYQQSEINISNTVNASDSFNQTNVSEEAIFRVKEEVAQARDFIKAIFDQYRSQPNQPEMVVMVAQETVKNLLLQGELKSNHKKILEALRSYRDSVQNIIQFAEKVDWDTVPEEYERGMFYVPQWLNEENILRVSDAYALLSSGATRHEAPSKKMSLVEIKRLLYKIVYQIQLVEQRQNYHSNQFNKSVKQLVKHANDLYSQDFKDKYPHLVNDPEQNQRIAKDIALFLEVTIARKTGIKRLNKRKTDSEIKHLNKHFQPDQNSYRQLIDLTHGYTHPDGINIYPIQDHQKKAIILEYFSKQQFSVEVLRETFKKEIAETSGISKKPSKAEIIKIANKLSYQELRLKLPKDILEPIQHHFVEQFKRTSEPTLSFEKIKGTEIISEASSIDTGNTQFTPSHQRLLHRYFKLQHCLKPMPYERDVAEAFFQERVQGFVEVMDIINNAKKIDQYHVEFENPKTGKKTRYHEEKLLIDFLKAHTEVIQIEHWFGEEKTLQKINELYLKQSQSEKKLLNLKDFSETNQVGDFIKLVTDIEVDESYGFNADEACVVNFIKDKFKLQAISNNIAADFHTIDLNDILQNIETLEDFERLDDNHPAKVNQELAKRLETFYIEKQKFQSQLNELRESLKLGVQNSQVTKSDKVSTKISDKLYQYNVRQAKSLLNDLNRLQTEIHNPGVVSYGKTDREAKQAKEKTTPDGRQVVKYIPRIETYMGHTTVPQKHPLLKKGKKKNSLVRKTKKSLRYLHPKFVSFQEALSNVQFFGTRFLSEQTNEKMPYASVVKPKATVDKSAGKQEASPEEFVQNKPSKTADEVSNIEKFIDSLYLTRDRYLQAGFEPDNPEFQFAIRETVIVPDVYIGDEPVYKQLNEIRGDITVSGMHALEKSNLLAQSVPDILSFYETEIYRANQDELLEEKLKDAELIDFCRDQLRPILHSFDQKRAELMALYEKTNSGDIQFGSDEYKQLNRDIKTTKKEFFDLMNKYGQTARKLEKQLASEFALASYDDTKAIELKNKYGSWVESRFAEFKANLILFNDAVKQYRAHRKKHVLLVNQHNLKKSDISLAEEENNNNKLGLIEEHPEFQKLHEAFTTFQSDENAKYSEQKSTTDAVQKEFNAIVFNFYEIYQKFLRLGFKQAEIKQAFVSLEHENSLQIIKDNPKYGYVDDPNLLKELDFGYGFHHEQIINVQDITNKIVINKINFSFDLLSTYFHVFKATSEISQKLISGFPKEEFCKEFGDELYQKISGKFNAQIADIADVKIKIAQLNQQISDLDPAKATPKIKKLEEQKRNLDVLMREFEIKLFNSVVFAQRDVLRQEANRLSQEGQPTDIKVKGTYWVDPINQFVKAIDNMQSNFNGNSDLEKTLVESLQHLENTGKDTIPFIEDYQNFQKQLKNLSNTKPIEQAELEKITAGESFKAYFDILFNQYLPFELYTLEHMHLNQMGIYEDKIEYQQLRQESLNNSPDATKNLKNLRSLLLQNISEDNLKAALKVAIKNQLKKSLYGFEGLENETLTQEQSKIHSIIDQKLSLQAELLLAYATFERENNHKIRTVVTFCDELRRNKVDPNSLRPKLKQVYEIFLHETQSLKTDDPLPVELENKLLDREHPITKTYIFDIEQSKDTNNKISMNKVAENWGNDFTNQVVCSTQYGEPKAKIWNEIFKNECSLIRHIEFLSGDLKKSKNIICGYNKGFTRLLQTEHSLKLLKPIITKQHISSLIDEEILNKYDETKPFYTLYGHTVGDYVDRLFFTKFKKTATNTGELDTDCFWQQHDLKEIRKERPYFEKALFADVIRLGQLFYPSDLSLYDWEVSELKSNLANEVIITSFSELDKEQIKNLKNSLEKSRKKIKKDLRDYEQKSQKNFSKQNDLISDLYIFFKINFEHIEVTQEQKESLLYKIDPCIFLTNEFFNKQKGIKVNNTKLQKDLDQKIPQIKKIINGHNHSLCEKGFLNYHLLQVNQLYALAEIAEKAYKADLKDCKALYTNSLGELYKKWFDEHVNHIKQVQEISDKGNKLKKDIIDAQLELLKNKGLPSEQVQKTLQEALKNDTLYILFGDEANALELKKTDSTFRVEKHTAEIYQHFMNEIEKSRANQQVDQYIAELIKTKKQSKQNITGQNDFERALKAKYDEIAARYTDNIPEISESLAYFEEKITHYEKEFKEFDGKCEQSLKKIFDEIYAINPDSNKLGVYEKLLPIYLIADDLEKLYLSRVLEKSDLTYEDYKNSIVKHIKLPDGFKFETESVNQLIQNDLKDRKERYYALWLKEQFKLFQKILKNNADSFYTFNKIELLSALQANITAKSDASSQPNKISIEQGTQILLEKTASEEFIKLIGQDTFEKIQNDLYAAKYPIQDKVILKLGNKYGFNDEAKQKLQGYCKLFNDILKSFKENTKSSHIEETAKLKNIHSSLYIDDLKRFIEERNAAKTALIKQFEESKKLTYDVALEQANQEIDQKYSDITYLIDHPTILTEKKKALEIERDQLFEQSKIDSQKKEKVCVEILLDNKVSLSHPESLNTAIMSNLESLKLSFEKIIDNSTQNIFARYIKNIFKDHSELFNNNSFKNIFDSLFDKQNNYLLKVIQIAKYDLTKTIIQRTGSDIQYGFTAKESYHSLINAKKVEITSLGKTVDSQSQKLEKLLNEIDTEYKGFTQSISANKSKFEESFGGFYPKFAQSALNSSKEAQSYKERYFLEELNNLNLTGDQQRALRNLINLYEKCVDLQHKLDVNTQTYHVKKLVMAHFEENQTRIEAMLLEKKLIKEKLDAKYHKKSKRSNYKKTLNEVYRTIDEKYAFDHPELVMSLKQLKRKLSDSDIELKNIEKSINANFEKIRRFDPRLNTITPSVDRDIACGDILLQSVSGELTAADAKVAYQEAMIKHFKANFDYDFKEHPQFEDLKNLIGTDFERNKKQAHIKSKKVKFEHIIKILADENIKYLSQTNNSQDFSTESNNAESLSSKLKQLKEMMDKQDKQTFLFYEKLDNGDMLYDAVSKASNRLSRELTKQELDKIADNFSLNPTQKSVFYNYADSIIGLYTKQMEYIGGVKEALEKSILSNALTPLQKVLEKHHQERLTSLEIVQKSYGKKTQSEQLSELNEKWIKQIPELSLTQEQLSQEIKTLEEQINSIKNELFQEEDNFFKRTAKSLKSNARSSSPSPNDYLLALQSLIGDLIKEKNISEDKIIKNLEMVFGSEIKSCNQFIAGHAQKNMLAFATKDSEQININVDAFMANDSIKEKVISLLDLQLKLSKYKKMTNTSGYFNNNQQIKLNNMKSISKRLRTQSVELSLLVGIVNATSAAGDIFSEDGFAFSLEKLNRLVRTHPSLEKTVNKILEIDKNVAGLTVQLFEAIVEESVQKNYQKNNGGFEKNLRQYYAERNAIISGVEDEKAPADLDSSDLPPNDLTSKKATIDKPESPYPDMGPDDIQSYAEAYMEYQKIVEQYKNMIADYKNCQEQLQTETDQSQVDELEFKMLELEEAFDKIAENTLPKNKYKALKNSISASYKKKRDCNNELKLTEELLAHNLKNKKERLQTAKEKANIAHQDYTKAKGSGEKAAKKEIFERAKANFNDIKNGFSSLKKQIDDLKENIKQIDAEISNLERESGKYKFAYNATYNVKEFAQSNSDKASATDNLQDGHITQPERSKANIYSKYQQLNNSFFETGFKLRDVEDLLKQEGVTNTQELQQKAKSLNEQLDILQNKLNNNEYGKLLNEINNLETDKDALECELEEQKNLLDETETSRDAASQIDYEYYNTEYQKIKEKIENLENTISEIDAKILQPTVIKNEYHQAYSKVFEQNIKISDDQYKNMTETEVKRYAQTYLKHLEIEKLYEETQKTIKKSEKEISGLDEHKDAGLISELEELTRKLYHKQERNFFNHHNNRYQKLLTDLDIKISLQQDFTYQLKSLSHKRDSLLQKLSHSPEQHKTQLQSQFKDVEKQIETTKAEIKTKDQEIKDLVIEKGKYKFAVKKYSAKSGSTTISSIVSPLIMPFSGFWVENPNGSLIEAWNWQKERFSHDLNLMREDLHKLKNWSMEQSAKMARWSKNASINAIKSMPNMLYKTALASGHTSVKMAKLFPKVGMQSFLAKDVLDASWAFTGQRGWLALRDHLLLEAAMEDTTYLKAAEWVSKPLPTFARGLNLIGRCVSKLGYVMVPILANDIAGNADTYGENLHSWINHHEKFYQERSKKNKYFNGSIVQSFAQTMKQMGNNQIGKFSEDYVIGSAKKYLYFPLSEFMINGGISNPNPAKDIDVSFKEREFIKRYQIVSKLEDKWDQETLELSRLIKDPQQRNMFLVNSANSKHQAFTPQLRTVPELKLLKLDRYGDFKQIMINRDLYLGSKKDKDGKVRYNPYARKSKHIVYGKIVTLDVEYYGKRKFVHLKLPLADAQFHIGSKNREDNGLLLPYNEQLKNFIRRHKEFDIVLHKGDLAADPEIKTRYNKHQTVEHYIQKCMENNRRQNLAFAYHNMSLEASINSPLAQLRQTKHYRLHSYEQPLHKKENRFQDLFVSNYKKFLQTQLGSEAKLLTVSGWDMKIGRYVQAIVDPLMLFSEGVNLDQLVFVSEKMVEKTQIITHKPDRYLKHGSSYPVTFKVRRFDLRNVDGQIIKSDLSSIDAAYYFLTHTNKVSVEYATENHSKFLNSPITVLRSVKGFGLLPQYVSCRAELYEKAKSLSKVLQVKYDVSSKNPHYMLSRTNGQPVMYSQGSKAFRELHQRFAKHDVNNHYLVKEYSTMNIPAYKRQMLLLKSARNEGIYSTEALLSIRVPYVENYMILKNLGSGQFELSKMDKFVKRGTYQDIHNYLKTQNHQLILVSTKAKHSLEMMQEKMAYSNLMLNAHFGSQKQHRIQDDLAKNMLTISRCGERFIIENLDKTMIDFHMDEIRKKFIQYYPQHRERKPTSDVEKKTYQLLYQQTYQDYRSFEDLYKNVHQPYEAVIQKTPKIDKENTPVEKVYKLGRDFAK